MNTSVSLLVGVSYKFFLGVQQDLGAVEEVHLEYFVGESKHDGVFGLQPLF